MTRNIGKEEVHQGYSRRDFIKTAALAAGAVGALSACGGQEPAQDAGVSKGLPITMAGYKFKRLEALVDGRVKVEGCDAQFEVAKIGDMNTHVFSGPKTRDVTEIGLHPFMLAYANDGFRDYFSTFDPEAPGKDEKAKGAIAVWFQAGAAIVRS